MRGKRIIKAATSDASESEIRVSAKILIQQQVSIVDGAWQPKQTV